MNKLRATIGLSFIMAIGFSCIFLSSCRKKTRDGMIIFTRFPKKVQNINYETGDSLKYIPQAQIVELDPDKPEASLKVLTSDYYSARAPQISYDGKYLLFSAQLKQNDPWQIWEMNLKNLKSRQIIASKENCTDPGYLPLGRFVFSKSTRYGKVKSGTSLFTCNLDGSDLQRITFDPHTYFASNIMSDGRILTIDQPVYPKHGDPKYMILRPDGTKTELFYKGTEGSNLSGQGLEIANGRVVFIESDKDSPATGKIISVTYNRPLHSKVNLISDTRGDFHSVYPEHSGKLLVSYRKS
jgi:Tol biopolymer transport system component